MDFDIDAVAAQIKAKFKKRMWLAGLAVLILAPIAAWILTALLTAAAIGIVCTFLAALSVVVINVLPAFMDRMANMRINLIVAEAMRSPIPTLQNDINQDRSDRNEDSTLITEYEKRILAIRQQFRALTADLGPADIIDFEQTLKEMEDDCEGMKQDLQATDALIEVKEKQLRRLSAWWDLNGAIIDIKDKVGARKAGEAIRKIKTDAALKSVNDQLAEARAKLRERVRNRKDPNSVHPALSNNPSPAVIEHIDTRAEAIIKVQR